MALAKLTSASLLGFILAAFAGCASSSSLSHARNAPGRSASAVPSVCLANGRREQQQGNLAGAYLWYQRGGRWDAQGQFTGFPSPGLLKEPEESGRFLCVLGFVETCQGLIKHGVVSDSGGVQLYKNLGEGAATISYYQSAHPKGYAGLTGPQIGILAQQADASWQSSETNQRAVESAQAAQHRATLAAMANVGEAAAMVARAASEVDSGAPAPPAQVSRARGGTATGAYVVNPNNARSNPGVPGTGGSLYDNYMQSARAYRNAAAQQPDAAKRASYLQSAQEMEAEAAKLRN